MFHYITLLAKLRNVSFCPTLPLIVLRVIFVFPAGLRILESRWNECHCWVELIFFPEWAKGVTRPSLSVPREWADVHPEKANHVPALGQHFWCPYQQGKSNADHCERQKCGPNIWNYCWALLSGWKMQEEQREDRNMGKYLSCEPFLNCIYY